MDKDKMEGMWNEAKGKAEEKAGEWKKDAGKKAEGMADQLKGKTQKAAGELKEEVEKRKKPAESTTGHPAGSSEEEERRKA